MRKICGKVPTNAVTKMRITASTKCIVMKDKRMERARITSTVIHTTVKAMARLPGVPPIQGKSFRKSSFPAPLRMCSSSCSLGGRDRSHAPHLSQVLLLLLNLTLRPHLGHFIVPAREHNRSEAANLLSLRDGLLQDLRISHPGRR